MASKIMLNGLRSIEECLNKNPKRIAKLLVPAGRLAPRLNHIKELAERQGVRVELNPKVDSQEPLLAVLSEYQYSDLEMLLPELKEAIAQGQQPVVLMLDGITDPHNLGAIIRTAAFAGVSALVLPKDRTALITDTVYRISSGGLEYVRIALATNLVSAIERLKKIGFWSVGFSEHAEKSLAEVKNDFPPLIVIGNEEKGIRHLVKENCDFLVKLQAKGGLHSLNASVAAAVAMVWATKMLE